jgi:ABC-type ATPase involved in cell division
MIALKNVTKSYGKKIILSDVSLRIDPAACLAIIGENGSGKTTILRLLIRAADPQSGSIEVDGVNIRTLPPSILQIFRRRVGTIFQELILIEHATVEENLALPLTMLNAPSALVQRNTNDLLQRIGLDTKAHLFPKDLSVGEKRLLCIARAIITAPMVILADEPLADLSSAQTQTVIELLTNMRKRGTTLVIFSRNDAVAKVFSAESLTLKDGHLTKQVDFPRTPKQHAEKTSTILEDTETPLSFITTDEEAVPIKSANTQSGGKRIRITSIGSNS